jgi:hypothetical protein
MKLYIKVADTVVSVVLYIIRISDETHNRHVSTILRSQWL